MSFFSYISAYFFVINEFNGDSCIKDMQILNDFLIYAAKRPFLKKVYQLNSHEKYIWENALIEITLKATWSEVKITQLCPTLCDPADCNLPCSSVHGILQARTLECIAIPFSRASSLISLSPALAGRCFTTSATSSLPNDLIGIGQKNKVGFLILFQLVYW